MWGGHVFCLPRTHLSVGELLSFKPRVLMDLFCCLLTSRVNIGLSQADGGTSSLTTVPALGVAIGSKRTEIESCEVLSIVYRRQNASCFWGIICKPQVGKNEANIQREAETSRAQRGSKSVNNIIQASRPVCAWEDPPLKCPVFWDVNFLLLLTVVGFEFLSVASAKVLTILHIISHS